MANWKTVLKQFPMSTKDVLAKIGAGIRTKVLDCIEMDADSQGNKTLAIRVKECDDPVKLNYKSCKALSEKWGDESEAWINKTVNIRPYMATNRDTKEPSYVVSPAT